MRGEEKAFLPDLWDLLAVYLIDVDRMETGRGPAYHGYKVEKGMFGFGDDKNHTSFRD